MRMKREHIFGLVFVLSILAISFVSANIFTDAWNSITGNAVSPVGFGEDSSEGVTEKVTAQEQEENQNNIGVIEDNSSEGDGGGPLIPVGAIRMYEGQRRTIDVEGESYMIKIASIFGNEASVEVLEEGSEIWQGTNIREGGSTIFGNLRVEVFDVYDSSSIFRRSYVVMKLSLVEELLCGNNVCNRAIPGKTMLMEGQGDINVSFNGNVYRVTTTFLTPEMGGELFLFVNGEASGSLEEGQSAVVGGLPIYIIDTKTSYMEDVESSATVYFGEVEQTCSEDCSTEFTYEGVLKMLNSCERYEWPVDPLTWDGDVRATEITGDYICETANKVCVAALVAEMTEKPGSPPNEAPETRNAALYHCDLPVYYSRDGWEMFTVQALCCSAP